MRLFVGQTQLSGSFNSYTDKLNFLELQAEPHRLPAVSKLERFKQQAPRDFVFSVAIPESVSSEDGDAARRREYGFRVARAVGASWVVLRTPASFRPSLQNEQELERLVAELSSQGFALAWEPHGLWQAPRARPLAERLGLQLVQDATEFDALPVTYLKSAGLGSLQRMGEATLERIALQSVGVQTLYLAVAAPGAANVRVQLMSLLEPEGEQGG